MIEIKKYCTDLEQLHIDFASKHWTKKRRFIPEYIYWKFRGKSNENLSSFILAIHENKVIGQLGLIPVNVRIEDKKVDAQWACDLMVDKDYRGNGIAKLLYDFAHNQKTLTLGSDPSPAASKSMKKNGYQSINGGWKLFFGLYIGEIFKLKKINFSFFNHIPNFFLLFFYFWRKLSSNKFKKININEFFEKEKIIDDSNEFIYVIQDQEFVKWRFNSFMTYYKELVIYEGSNNDFFSGFYNDGCFVIADYSTKNSIGFFDMISNIIFMYKKNGLRSIKFLNNNHKFSNFLLFFGFIKFSTITEIIYFTNNKELNIQIANKKFLYTYLDSDENI
jgi:GNAT superfamily N-acetyltransferase